MTENMTTIIQSLPFIQICEGNKKLKAPGFDQRLENTLKQHIVCDTFLFSKKNTKFDV